MKWRVKKQECDCERFAWTVVEPNGTIYGCRLTQVDAYEWALRVITREVERARFRQT